MRRSLAPLLAAALLPACALLAEAGSGVTVERRITVTPDVTRVEIADGFAAEIRVGPAPAGTVTIDDNLVDRLRVRVDGDTLRLGLDGRVRDATLRVSVAIPALASLTASDASEVTVSGTLVGDVTLEADGASSISIGAVEADRLEIEVSGSSRVEAGGGTAARLDASASGASELSVAGVQAERANVEASGASRIDLHVLDLLDARASGSSTVTYAGEPSRVLVDSSGSSRVERA